MSRRCINTDVVTVWPSFPATDIAWNAVSTSSVTFSWTNGDGPKRIVLCKENATTIVEQPMDGHEYTANSVFGSGDAIDPNQLVFCVYAGSGTTVTVTGLKTYTRYVFRVVEANGYGSETHYYHGKGTNTERNRFTSAS